MFLNPLDLLWNMVNIGPSFSPCVILASVEEQTAGVTSTDTSTACHQPLSGLNLPGPELQLHPR